MKPSWGMKGKKAFDGISWIPQEWIEKAESILNDFDEDDEDDEDE